MRPLRCASPSSHAKPRATVVLGILALLTFRCVGKGFREDELACERASMRVSTCCPGAPLIDSQCSYSEASDCAGEEVLPVFTVKQSKCVDDTPCETMQSSGFCAAIAAAVPPPVAAGGADGGDRAGAGGARAGGAAGRAGAAGDVTVYPTVTAGSSGAPDRSSELLRAAIDGRAFCK